MEANKDQLRSLFRRGLHEQSDDLFPGLEFEMRCLMITIDVNIDRPFLYSIVGILQDQKNENVVPLFTGIVTVPTY